MDSTTQLPRRWLAAAILLAAVPVSVLLGLIAELAAGAFSLEGAARLTLTALLFALPLALALGVPVAWWRLRDARASVSQWGAAGLASGVAGGVAVNLWFAAMSPLERMFGPAAPWFIALIVAVTCAGGVLTALLARRIARALAHRFG